MKKQVVLTIAVLGMAGVLLSQVLGGASFISSPTGNRFVLFGKVETEADDQQDTREQADEESGQDDWFEGLIKEHKTPFTKVIVDGEEEE